VDSHRLRLTAEHDSDRAQVVPGKVDPEDVRVVRVVGGQVDLRVEAGKDALVLDGKVATAVIPEEGKTYCRERCPWLATATAATTAHSTAPNTRRKVNKGHPGARDAKITRLPVALPCMSIANSRLSVRL
jgi:hypothetical protein